jgi:Fic family protein
MKPKVDAPASDILQRIRSEFSEMPGLKLTSAQAQRLWAIDPPTCERVINSLTESGFLVRTRDGAVIVRGER